MLHHRVSHLAMNRPLLDITLLGSVQSDTPVHAHRSILYEQFKKQLSHAVQRAKPDNLFRDIVADRI